MKVAGCVALLVAVIVVFSQSTTASPSSRLSKRSVNFTPSWGKRSGGYDIHPLVPNLSSEVQSEKCATEMYLRRLVERLQVSDLPHFHTFPIFVPILFWKTVTDYSDPILLKKNLFFFSWSWRTLETAKASKGSKIIWPIARGGDKS